MKRIVLAAIAVVTFSISEHSIPKIPNNKELICLATNVYYEARGESLVGQIAVAKVVLNRGGDICTEVFKPYQFSWTRVKQKITYDYNSINAVILAFNLDSKFDATHYHAKSVSPYWAKKLEYVQTIGNHIFYKEVK